MQAELLTPNQMFDLLNEADLDAITRGEAVGLIGALRTWLTSADPPEVFPLLGYDILLDGEFVVSLEARTEEGALKTAQALGALTHQSILMGQATAIQHTASSSEAERYRVTEPMRKLEGRGSYVFDLGSGKWCYVNGGVGEFLEIPPEDHMASLDWGDENVSDAG